MEYYIEIKKELTTYTCNHTDVSHKHKRKKPGTKDSISIKFKDRQKKIFFNAILVCLHSFF